MFDRLASAGSDEHQRYAVLGQGLLGGGGEELMAFCCQREYRPDLSPCWDSFEEHALCCFRGLRRRLGAGPPTPAVSEAAWLELAPWRARGRVGRRDIEEFSRCFGGVFCHLRVAAGEVVECDLGSIPALSGGNEYGEDRFQYETLLTALRVLVLLDPNITGHLFVSPHKWDDEQYEVPVWVRARPSFAPGLVRMPYYSVLSKQVEARSRLYAEAAGEGPPWLERIDRVFWRGDFTPSWTRCACDGSTLAPSASDFAPPEARRLGAASGAAAAGQRCRCRMEAPTRATWRRSPRFAAVNLSIHFGGDVDARFSKIFSGAREQPRWRGILPERGDVRLATEHSAEGAPSRYRYVLDVDGTTVSTDRPYSLLATGAVLFKQASGLEPWLYGGARDPGAEGMLLRPYEHFVPVAADLSDLRARLSWARAHEGECQRIAARALAWSSRWHSQEYAYEYIYHLLKGTGSLIE